MGRRLHMANKKVTKQPLVLSEDILIGKIGLSDTQHIDISIVKCQGKGYLSIKKAYTKKDGEIVTKSAVWIPFAKSKHLPDIIVEAINEGLNRHYNKEHKTPKVIDIPDEDETWSPF